MSSRIVAPKAFDGGGDPGGDQRDTASAVDRHQKPGPFVPGEKRRAESGPHLKAVRDDVGGVIHPVLTLGPVAKPYRDLGVTDDECDHNVNGRIQLTEHAPQCHGLFDSSRSPVEDPAAAPGGISEWRTKHSQHIREWHEVARGDGRCDPSTELRAGGYFGTQHCTDRDMDNAKMAGEQTGLGTLPGTRRAEHDRPHTKASIRIAIRSPCPPEAQTIGSLSRRSARRRRPSSQRRLAC